MSVRATSHARETLRDAAHSYELPRAEAMKAAGLVCFSGDGVKVEFD